MSISNFAKNTTRKFVAALKDNNLRTGANADRTKKALLGYLTAQTMDSNLHPLSRVYAGVCIMQVAHGVTPRRAVFSGLSGTSWIFAKNKKKAFLQSFVICSTLASVVKPSPEREILEAVEQLHYETLEKLPQYSIEAKQANY